MESKSSSTDIFIGAAAGGCVLVLLLLLAGIYAFRQKKRAKRATQLNDPFASWDSNSSSTRGPQLKGARCFAYKDLKKCTNNFSEVNAIGSGGYGKLKTLLLQKDTYLNYSQALSYTSQALSQNVVGLRKKSSIQKISTKFVYYLEENWKRLWVLCFLILIMAGLFTWKFFQYKEKNAYKVMGYCLLTAKGAAETLKFNMALNYLVEIHQVKLRCAL